MADRKISDLTALTTPASGDYLPIVDISEAAAASKNKRITIEELMRGVPDGTAAAPGIAFEADPNTGIYSPGADQLAVATNGTGRLFINSTGLVGIGSSAPGSPLTIAGNYTGTSNMLELRTTAGGADGGGRIVWKKPQDEFLNSFISSSRVGATSAGQIEFGTAADIYAANATTKMVILGSGNVGIGTTSPGSALEINAAAATSPFIAKINTSEAARIDSSGRLLVGTSSARPQFGVTPLTQIEGVSSSTTSFGIINNVASAAGAYIFLGKSRSASLGSVTAVTANDVLGGIYFQGANGSDLSNCGAAIEGIVDGTVSGGGANDMPGRLVFSTTADGSASPTERMRINSSGFLKAGNSGAYLSATGGFHEIRSTNSNNQALQVSHGGTSGEQYGMYITTANDQNDTTRWFLECVGGATIRATIRSNGGLANYSANNANLSDRNAKKDISPAAGTWNCLKEWEIVNYRYKDQPDDADLNLGVIAQQVAESCPEVITVFEEAKEATEDAPAQEERLGVKEQQMYWMAIKALQEAQVRIEQLEQRLTDAGIA